MRKRDKDLSIHRSSKCGGTPGLFVPPRADSSCSFHKPHRFFRDSGVLFETAKEEVCANSLCQGVSVWGCWWCAFVCVCVCVCVCEARTERERERERKKHDFASARRPWRHPRAAEVVKRLGSTTSATCLGTWPNGTEGCQGSHLEQRP